MQASRRTNTTGTTTAAALTPSSPPSLLAEDAGVAGAGVGSSVDGDSVGAVGCKLGSGVGELVGEVGADVGAADGAVLGATVGAHTFPSQPQTSTLHSGWHCNQACRRTAMERRESGGEPTGQDKQIRRMMTTTPPTYDSSTSMIHPLETRRDHPAYVHGASIVPSVWRG